VIDLGRSRRDDQTNSPEVIHTVGLADQLDAA
jgi:hypothetical protein